MKSKLPTRDKRSMRVPANQAILIHSLFYDGDMHLSVDFQFHYECLTNHARMIHHGKMRLVKLAQIRAIAPPYLSSSCAARITC
jgi:hypothetical protein